jgi:hypothetical protein
MLPTALTGMNFNGVSKILCVKCAKNINDCHPKACMGAPDQKNNIAGSYASTG